MTLAVLISSYGYYAIAAGAFFEGETMLVLGGLAAHQGYLSFPVVLACAFAATFATDQFYFSLGRLKGIARLEQHPRWKIKLERVFLLLRRHQTPLALFFRFLYGMRIVVPVALGATGIPRWRFLALDLLGSAAWVGVYGTLGYLFGSTVQTFLGDLKHIEIWIFAAVFAVGLFIWARHRWRLRRAALSAPKS